MTSPTVDLFVSWPTPIWIPPPGLERGDAGGAVRRLQDLLIELLYLPASAREGAGYGTFGPMTESALKAFQADRGLPQVGNFGPDTYEELQRALAGQPPLNGIAVPAPGGGIFPPPHGFAAIKATFGEAGKGVVKAQLPLGRGGKPVKVAMHEKLVPVMKACLEDAKKKDLLKHIKAINGASSGAARGKKNARSRGEAQPSVHSWGIAFGIKSDPRRGKVHPDLVKHFKEWGFKWGGDFQDNGDPTHFQYASGY
jgi:peptidoglycan hydrolase-like protein with peptidoglycan-binding domain